MMNLCLVVVASLLGALDATPDGAASCPIGRPATRGFHSIGTPVETSLEERGFVFSGVSKDLVVGEPVTVSITAPPDTPFRGFLIRVDGDAMIEAADTKGQDASACPGGLGVAHVINDVKTVVEATVIALFAGPLEFDVTVVENHSAEKGNQYSWAHFQVRAHDMEVVNSTTTTPTTTPAKPPTESPTVTPIQSPTTANVAPMPMPFAVSTNDPAVSEKGGEDSGFGLGAVVGIIVGVIVISLALVCGRSAHGLYKKHVGHISVMTKDPRRLVERKDSTPEECDTQSLTEQPFTTFAC